MASFRRDSQRSEDTQYSRDPDSTDEEEDLARLARLKNAGQVAKGNKKRQPSPSKPSAKSQAKLTENHRQLSTSDMGLNDFLPRMNKPKANSLSSIPANLKWPLEKYEFRLACQLCFRRQGEGINGFKFLQNHPHTCPHNILLVHKKRGNSIHSWMKIRMRPNTETYFQTYRLCENFRNAQRCRVGEEECMFAHNNAEIELWNMERNKVFDLYAFMKAAQKEGINSSEALENRYRKQPSSPSKQQQHPVGYTPAAASKGETQPVKTASMMYQPKIQQIKVPSSQPPKMPWGSSPQTTPATVTANGFLPNRPLPPSLSGNFSVPPPFVALPPNTAYPPPLPPNTAYPPPHAPMYVPSPSFGPKHGPKPGTHRAGSSAQQKHERPAVLIANPLPKFHFELCCSQCLTLKGGGWLYDFKAGLKHPCSQNRLAYCIKDQNGQDSWVQVRERLSHRDFPGNYALCYSVNAGSRLACNRLESCSFAHNAIEKQIWGMEKAGKFNISEFILQHHGKLSDKGNMSANSVQELIAMYGGYMRYICRMCYFSNPCQISSEGDRGTCAGKMTKHNWQTSRVLAHVNNGTYTVVDRCKLLHSGAYYKMCTFLNYCQDRRNTKCIFAHSRLEMSIWRLERDTDMSRDDLIRHSSEIYTKGHYKNQAAGAAAASKPDGGGEEARAGSAPMWQGGGGGFVEEVPVKIGEFCMKCWGTGIKSTLVAGKDECSRQGHGHFKMNRVYLALSTSKEIRTLPPGTNPGMRFQICNNGNKCQKAICTYSHTNEEQETWNYMAKHSIRELEEIVARCQQEKERVAEAAKATNATNTKKTSTLTKGQPVVDVVAASPPSSSAWMSAEAKPASQIIAPGDLNLNEFHCPYCSVSCHNQSQWDDHCTSPKHKETVLWDQEHQWNHRQPPWGQTDSLRLCASHVHFKTCRYSTVPDKYNLCKYAHSQDELDEWKERHEFRKMKRTMALERHIFSYTESLMDDYDRSDKNAAILSETVPGVVMKCDHLSAIYKKEKSATHTWTLTVNTKKTLEKVSLLLNPNRLHFHLATPEGTQHQVAAGSMFLVVDDKTGKYYYKVQVVFRSGMFGSFGQWLALDFGSRPILFRKLTVDVGHHMNQVKVQELRENLTFSRWTSENKEVVEATESKFDEFDRQLLAKYKEPVSIDAIVTSDSLKELNQHNYTHKMHKLLDLEEMTRHRMVASYNMKMDVTASSTIDEVGSFIVAQRGELFLKVQFSDAVTEDTEAGKLLLTSVRTALVASPDSKSKQVYEVTVVQEGNYNYDSLGKDYVYFFISKSSAASLGLSPGATTPLEIQFQLDRLFFCRIHHALDQMRTMDAVFPDVLKFKSCLGRSMKVSPNLLNEDQLKAVKHIVIDRDIYSPPFIMYGPFGTGKTETLAQATMTLLMEKKACRVLICTQSNSAADLYVTNHLNQFLTTVMGKYKLLRIYAKERKKSSVPAAMIPYCYMKEDGQWALPSKEVILQHQVVIVTVESSIHLTHVDLHGCFTHIFVDEAGQTLECQILIPLCLASPKTCVVLAGDHLQTSPAVYSKAARDQSFDVPILVRLYNFYDQMARGCIAGTVVEKYQKSPLKIQLSINYRTKTEILKFISTVFYGGPDILKAEANIPSVPGLTPVAFFSVQGKESQSSEASSYMNAAEVVEVMAQVKAMLDNWPQEWGPQNPQAIAVLTNYRQQVKYIRQMFNTSASKKKGLNQVFVGTVLEVQGKEFRAVFISTVRTTNLLQEPHILQTLNEGRDIGDLGFLSNPKLLNTALTRAQSFVGVVGDPIALCVIGDCIQEWRTYIKYCSSLGSIQPPSHDYNFVRNQVVQLQVGPGGRVVDMLSRQKDKDASSQSFPPLQQPLSLSGDDGDDGDDEEEEEDEGLEGIEDEIEEEEEAAASVEELPPFMPPPPPPPHTMPSTSSGGGAGSERDNLNQFMDSMEMFFQQQMPTSVANNATGQPKAVTPPHKQTPVKKKKKTRNEMGEEEEGDLLTLTGEVSTEDIVSQLGKENSDASSLVKSDSIRVTEKDGFACLTYSADPPPDSQAFKVTTYDEDFVAFVGKDRTGLVLYECWSADKLASHAGMAGIFRCTMGVVGEKRVATILPPKDRTPLQAAVAMDWTGREVMFDHPFDCGHSMTGDEVLVKLSDKSTPGRLIGQVKGILRSACDKTSLLLVCEVSPDEPGILKPLDTRFPCLYALTTGQRLALAQKGNLPVYRFSHTQGIEFDRYHKLPASPDKQPRLFVVRYLTWIPKLTLPVALVVAMLDASTPLDLGSKVLRVEHQLAGHFLPQAAQEADQAFGERGTDLSLTPEMMKGRLNLSALYCFSVTEKGTQDVAMAVHLEDAGDNYRVGVHVSDVASFLAKDSVLDRECELRSPSVFPPREGGGGVGGAGGAGGGQQQPPRHMLPEQACTNRCSLKTGCDQLAVSILMTFDSTGQPVEDALVVPSVVNVKQHFTQAEVEKILLESDPGGSVEHFQSCVVTLYSLTFFWRTHRLGNASFGSSLTAGQQAMPHVHLMMEELKHRVNTTVASLLVTSFPQCTPLVVQAAPSRDKLDRWRQESARHVFNSIPMSLAYLDNQVCRCAQLCTCVYAYMRARQLQPFPHVTVLREAWDALCQAGSTDDFDSAKDLISDVRNMPDLALCQLKWEAIKQPERFACAGQLSAMEKQHHGIKVAAYTLFTDPLRHFISIVVQRLLIAHTQGSGSPYTAQEMAELCALASARQAQKSRFDCQSFHLYLGAALETHPLPVTAFVETVDPHRIRLTIPGLEGIPQEDRTLTLWDTTPTNVKAVDDAEGCVRIHWEERIHDLTADPRTPPPPMAVRGQRDLDTNRQVFSLPTARWQQLLMDTRRMAALNTGEAEFNAFTTHLQEVSSLVAGDRPPSPLEPVSPLPGHPTPLSMLLHPGQCIPVQLGSGVRRGLVSPRVKLLGLTDRLDLCLEHREDPMACFCGPTHDLAPSTSYPDMVAYQHHWRARLTPGFVRDDMKQGERTTLHGVRIAWTSGRLSASAASSSGQEVVFGEITLSKNLGIRLDGGTSGNNSEQCLAYLCVRYKDVDLDPCLSPDPNVKALVNAKPKVTWVGHCRVTSIDHVKDKAKVGLRLVQSSFGIPEPLLNGKGDNWTCSLEWIGRGDKHRLFDETVRHLDQASQFAKDVVLGQMPTNTIEPVEMPKGMYLEHLAPAQQVALRDGYNNPLTCVLGGAGTGKSILASCLAALLVFRNSKVDTMMRQHTKPGVTVTQLMVCAPTEHALDILTANIKALKQDISLIRVYSQDIEESDFPSSVRQDGNRFEPRTSRCVVMKDVALHHLIRVPGKTPQNDILLQQELMTSMCGDNASQLSALDSAVVAAQSALLVGAQIIVCTCLTSALPLLRNWTNVRQIIIDDSGHCSELECLVPVVWHSSVHQVALLGDRQTAQSSSQGQGHKPLGQSLVHRLGDVVRTDLYQHFRSPSSLCEFPSSYFYSGMLQATVTQPSTAIPSFPWPSGKAGGGFHSLFYHMEGRQESVGGALSGEDDSFINKEEATMVRNLVWSMVDKQQVAPSSILVLTFSPAHKLMVQNALLGVSLTTVPVTTVRESVGREGQIVIVSTARSVPPEGVAHPPLTSWVRRHLGSVADPYLINVALTRAMKALFIFGNQDLLSVCDPWRSLLEFYRRRQAVVTRLDL